MLDTSIGFVTSLVGLLGVIALAFPATTISAWSAIKRGWHRKA